MYDVAIIGAGIIGGMTARALAKYNLKICILEKENDVAMGASKANSGIVHAGFDAIPGTLKACLNVKGSKMMPLICKELGVNYKNNGSLVVGYSPEERTQLYELLRRGRQNGVSGLRILNKEQLRRREPNLSEDALCALYAPTGSIVCPYDLTIAAIGNAMDNGVELFRNFKVTGVFTSDDGYTIHSDNTSLRARFVINCAGIYSADIAKMIGDSSFDICPRKGEYLLLDKDCKGLVSCTIFGLPSKMGKGILVSPTVDDNLLLGPTSVDTKNKSCTATSVEGLEDIVKNAKHTVPTIPIQKTITSFCGLRATGTTGDFILTSPQKGFLNAAGIESPGLSAAPAIAEYIVALLEKQGLSLTLNPSFRPYRTSIHHFRNASLKEKNQIIQQDPAYGKIVCRCEHITEGEILHAIRQNPKPLDLDGVKRRTRAQMGRCQGGFCMPHIVRLLSNELGIPYASVTKSGGYSRINISRTKETNYE